MRIMTAGSWKIKNHSVYTSMEMLTSVGRTWPCQVSSWLLDWDSHNHPLEDGGWISWNCREKILNRRRIFKIFCNDWTNYCDHFNPLLAVEAESNTIASGRQLEETVGFYFRMYDQAARVGQKVYWLKVMRYWRRRGIVRGAELQGSDRQICLKTGVWEVAK